MTEFIKVSEESELWELAVTANKVWHEFFPCILSPEQIDYMVEKFQSYEALKNQIKNDNYEYYFINYNGERAGYIGIKNDGDRLFLSKLYLIKDFRGKGIASKTFEFIKTLCKERNLKAVWLTVNKYNENTISVYLKKGFEIIDSQVADIGNGYVMDDYIMQLDI